MAIGHIENKEHNNQSLSLLICINLNVNELNILIKRQRLAEWINTHDQLYAVYKRLS